jgi:homogentisate 1,2-dioxygenase
MTEFMGLISGGYDAKAEGFLPGGASLHSMMTAHGPDRDTFDKASNDKLVPVKLRPDGLAFMFETSHIMSLSKWSLSKDHDGGKVLQKDYYKCWQGLDKNFNPSSR